MTQILGMKFPKEIIFRRTKVNSINFNLKYQFKTNSYDIQKFILYSIKLGPISNRRREYQYTSYLNIFEKRIFVNDQEQQQNYIKDGSFGPIFHIFLALLSVSESFPLLFSTSGRTRFNGEPIYILI